MDESDTRNKYAYLDQLSTEMLETILRADIESPEGGDGGMILYITEVLARREKENPTGRLYDVDEAWKEFQEYYNIPEGDDLSLYPMTEPEDDCSVHLNCNDLLPAEEGPKAAHTKAAESASGNYTKKRLGHRYFMRVLPVAATIAILLGCMITAQAAGLDVFGALAKWTDETFHFILSQEESDESCSTAKNLHDTFQSALDECGVLEVLAPTWFPAGCVMIEEPDLMKTSFTSKITCEYEVANQHFFTITVQLYNSEIKPVIMETEKDAAPVEQYVANGKRFYIMTNNDSVNAAWSDEKSLLMTISGNILLEDLKKILDSIGEKTL